MTENSRGYDEAHHSDDNFSILAFGSLLLRFRRVLIGATLLGIAVGLAVGLTSRREYVSSATFIPQTSEAGSSSGLAMAASQLGLRIPSSSSAWGPSVYVELLRSRTLLEPIVLDSLVVEEKKGQRIAILDLLDISGSTHPLQVERSVRELGNLISVSEDKKLNAVKLKVTSPWPSVSRAITERLLKGVNQFNLKERKSQASAERQFAGALAGEAETALRDAEDKLQRFMERNRTLSGSPALTLEQDRLRRDVTSRQQLYTTLLQNREEARIREVRDTPVITVLEEPQLPIQGESRRSIQKGLVGGLVGLMFGLAFAFISQAIFAARARPDATTQEFFDQLRSTTPVFLAKFLN